MYNQLVKKAVICTGLSIFVLFNVNAQQKTSTSDKQKTLQVENSLAKVMQLDPVQFSPSGPQTGKPYGFKIEDLEKVFPEIVKQEGKFVPAGKNAFKTEKVKSVDLESLIPILIASMKEQQAEIAELKSELQKLKEAK